MKEAELLFAEIFNCDRASLYLNKNLQLDKNKALFISSVLKRRALGEPLQYILGKTEFMGLEFIVTPDVLIPRPETELLVEKTIEVATRAIACRPAGNCSHLKILDLGTGSGCIAISLAKFFPQTKIDAIDISKEALKVARQNAKIHNVKINFSRNQGDTQYDIIVSNPPYIPKAEINYLQLEVRFEPRIALDGGVDGLDFYRKIAASSAQYLKKGGFLLLEIGFGQIKQVKNIFQKSAKFEIIDIIKDYNKIDRVVVAKLR